MARRGRKKSTGSCLFPILVIIFILGAIGAIGGKKDKTSSVPERTRNESSVVDNKIETAKSGKEAVAKSEKEVKTVIPDKEDNSSSSQIETAVTEKKETGNETARDSLLRSNIRTKDLKETEAIKQDSSESAPDVVPDDDASTEVKFESIKRGDSGDSVKEVQTQLVALGFLASSADGKFGSGTEQAVIDFQNANHLEPTGTIDKATYDAILSANSEEIVFSSVKRGDTGDSIKEIQKQLASLGYYTSSADGKFGVGTEQAVIDFQTANQIEASGIVDQETYQKMFSGEAKHYTSSGLQSDIEESSSDVETRTSGERLVWIPTNGGTKYHSDSSCSGMIDPIQVTVDEAQARGFDPCSKCSSAYSTASSRKATDPKPAGFTSIRRGDTGDSVVEIQKRLSELGYLNSSADGKFGSGTEQAVKDFQSANSLSASGVVDEGTYNELFSSGAKKHVAPILVSDVDESTADVGTRNSSDPLVWIPNSGSKYHSNSGCSRMKNPTQVTRSQAEAMGYTPCSKCY